MTKELFEKKLESYLQANGTTTIANADANQLHNAISSVVMESIDSRWATSKKTHNSSKQACYFSMEFLVGRAIMNNLMVLGLQDVAEEVLREHNSSIALLEDVEDAALGNGGLGRLAACFLESAATTNIPLNGFGIRYRYGLFKQKFDDGFQKELPDDWTSFGDPWSKRNDLETVIIEFADQKVKAVPYDMPIIGYKTENIGTLRLWQAEPIQAFDFDLFNSQDYISASKEQIFAEDISRVLYPNDDTKQGKILRIKQEYFFTSASITDILKKYQQNGQSLTELHKSYFIQLNDTHPVFAIPELIRQLVDIHEMPFPKALELAKKTYGYTNHTVMSEALEKWNVSLVKAVLPRIYEIIFQIHESMMTELYQNQVDKELIDKIKILQSDTVHMANLAIYASSYTNGVAELHTQILKDDALKEWYQVYPNRFQNKTNGITPRRWIGLNNPELSQLITSLLGNDNWLKDLTKLSSLKAYKDDNDIIEKFTAIKHLKKKQLAEFIAQKEGIDINPNSIFDIQIKRMHEYKRQLLNAFGIMYLYFGIKNKTIENFQPTTFIFGGKSAPGYARAKAVIKYINEIAKLVSSDSETKNLIKVVFVENYNVSYAEKLVCAADVSEQISTAGTEASGTGNMKFMLNGAVTLGTLDGANVEIVAEAGQENNYIFGATVEQMPELMKTYDPRQVLEQNPDIRQVIDTLIDGTVSDNGTGIFRDLYLSLLEGASWHRPDNYYLIGDLRSFVETRLKLNNDYLQDHKSFMQKCWVNMASAGKFSSDRTIEDYAKEIWGVSPV